MIESFLNRIRKQDWIITIVVLILLGLSLMLIFSTTYDASNALEGQDTILKQLVFIIFGIIIYLLITGIKLDWFEQSGLVYFIYGVILLSLIFLIGFGEVIQETKRWIVLGPISFQPAEFAKLGIVILTAYIFTHDFKDIPGYQIINEQGEKNNSKLLKKFLLSFISFLLYAILIFIQPALGNSIILLFVWGILIFLVIPISNKSLMIIFISMVALFSYFQVGIFSQIAQNSYLPNLYWKIFVLVATIVVFLTLALKFKFNKILLVVALTFLVTLGPAIDYSWNSILKDYHRERVEAYLDGFNSDPLDRDYQVRQSLISFGSGQLFGQGYLQGGQATLRSLPFAHTDFIFAALGNQFGFIGVVILFFLYGIIIYRSINIYLITNNNFAKLIVAGCITIITTNIIINTGMNIGIMPVTGVPLPLISYGGSSLILTMICIGLIQSVHTSTIHASDYSFKLSNNKI